jgi:hypothetical protein
VRGATAAPGSEGVECGAVVADEAVHVPPVRAG